MVNSRQKQDFKKWDRTPKIPDAVCGVEVDPDISGLDGEFSSEA